MAAEPFAVVVDPGIDDAVALAVLAGVGTVPDVVVAVPGNVDGATAADNACGVLALLGLDVAFRSWLGTGPPATRPGGAGPHGADGFGGLAGRLPLGLPPDPLRNGDWPPSVLALTPLTTVAAAVEAGEAVERVLWMGGATGAGNVTAAAEFNAWADAGAADRVLRSGLDVSVVPLDVTGRVVLGGDDLERLTAGGGAAGVLAEAVATRPTGVVHDAVAAVAWLRPDLFAWRRSGARCLTDGADRGRLVLGGPGATAVATDVDVAAVTELIVTAVGAC